MPERPPEKIVSERLLLRIPTMEDAFQIFQLYAQDPEVTKYLTFEPHQSIKDTKTFLKRCLNNWKKNTSFSWTIIRRHDKQLMGMIEIVNIEQLPGHIIVKVKLPVAEMIGLASDIRSATEGRGTFSMVDQTFERVPPNLQPDVVRKIRDRKGLKENE